MCFYTDDDMWLAEGLLLKEGFIIQENKMKCGLPELNKEMLCLFLINILRH